MSAKTEHIVYADDSMIPDLTGLWMEAFGDEREYVDFYFANRYAKNNLLVYLEEGKAVSMISILPVLLHGGGKKIPARYVYAVATRKDCRGWGYARELILEAKRLLQEPLLLEPAEEGLAEYYRKMGFCDAFSVREYDLLKESEALQAAREIYDLAAAEIPAEKSHIRRQPQRYWLLTITPSEYHEIRNMHFAGEGFVEWNKEAIAYALLENEFSGGFAYKIFHDEQEDIFMYRMEGERLNIIETTPSISSSESVVEKLRIHPREIMVRRPAHNCSGIRKSVSQRMFGMLLWEERIEEGYLNLTLE